MTHEFVPFTRPDLVDKYPGSCAEPYCGLPPMDHPHEWQPHDTGPWNDHPGNPCGVCRRPESAELHTAAAPTEQATQPAEVCEHRDITWEDGVLVCGDCEQPVPETAAGGYQTSAGDAATDVDSTAEAAKRYPLLEANLAADLAAYVDKQNAAQVDRTALREQGPLQPGRREDNVSAGSPVTAGVPDTAALRDWLSRGSDAWVVGSLRNRVGDLLAALDAARGELVTARGERDEANDLAARHRRDWYEACERGTRFVHRAQRAEAAEAERNKLQALIHQMETDLHEACQDARRDNLAAHANMIRAEGAEAERDQALRDLAAMTAQWDGEFAHKMKLWEALHVARDELAAANARIAAVEALCDAAPHDHESWMSDGNPGLCLPCAVRAALAGVPAAGDAPKAT